MLLGLQCRGDVFPSPPAIQTPRQEVRASHHPPCRPGRHFHARLASRGGSTSRRATHPRAPAALPASAGRPLAQCPARAVYGRPRPLPPPLVPPPLPPRLLLPCLLPPDNQQRRPPRPLAPAPVSGGRGGRRGRGQRRRGEARVRGRHCFGSLRRCRHPRPRPHPAATHGSKQEGSSPCSALLSLSLSASFGLACCLVWIHVRPLRCVPMAVTN